MPTFKVKILANNEAGDWQSWPEKIAAIRAFYAPRCNLDITFQTSDLKPVFVELPIGSKTLVVDETWYQQNISAFHKDQNFIIFVVPPSDHAGIVTYQGYEAGHGAGPWDLTVFSDETSHNYAGAYAGTEGNQVKDLGEQAVIMCEHELSHAFYAMFNALDASAPDNTHLYFFAGTPEKVLEDFNFESKIDQIYHTVIALLKQIYLLKKNQ